MCPSHTQSALTSTLCVHINILSTRPNDRQRNDDDDAQRIENMFFCSTPDGNRNMRLCRARAHTHDDNNDDDDSYSKAQIYSPLSKNWRHSRLSNRQAAAVSSRLSLASLCKYLCTYGTRISVGWYIKATRAPCNHSHHRNIRFVNAQICIQVFQIVSTREQPPPPPSPLSQYPQPPRTK